MWRCLRHLFHPAPPIPPLALPLTGGDTTECKGMVRQAVAKFDAANRKIQRQASINGEAADRNTDALTKLVEAMHKRAENK